MIPAARFRAGGQYLLPGKQQGRITKACLGFAQVCPLIAARIGQLSGVDGVGQSGIGHLPGKTIRNGVDGGSLERLYLEFEFHT